MPGFVFFDRNDAVKCVIDRMIPCATAEISLKSKSEIFLLFFRKTGGRHEHTRRAKAALICLSTEKCFLHRVELAVLRQTAKSGDFAAFCSKSGNEAAMNWFAIDPHRACSAVAGVTSFFHFKPGEIAKECS